MEENVKIDLTSRADVSGFQQFEQASTRLTTAKLEGTKANSLLVDSERRVRSNLMDSLTGFATAKDMTDGVSSAINHLGDILNIGFGGAILGGIASGLVELFGRADAAIQQTTEQLKAAGDAAEATINKIQGIQPTEQQTLKDQISKQMEMLQRAQNSDAGFFNMNNLVQGLNIISGGTAFEGNVKNIQLDQAQQARLQEDITQESLLAGNPKNFNKAKADANADEKRRIQEDFARQEFASEKEFQDQGKAFSEAQKRTAEEAQRTKEDADRKAKDAADEKAKAAARSKETANKEEAKAADEILKPGKIHATILAGSQRQLGGGGGVFSSITIDPAVVEAKKQTSLQQQMLALLQKGQASGPPLAVAA